MSFDSSITERLLGIISTNLNEFNQGVECDVTKLVLIDVKIKELGKSINHQLFDSLFNKINHKISYLRDRLKTECVVNTEGKLIKSDKFQQVSHSLARNIDLLRSELLNLGTDSMSLGVSLQKFDASQTSGINENDRRFLQDLVDYRQIATPSISPPEMQVVEYNKHTTLQPALQPPHPQPSLEEQDRFAIEMLNSNDGNLENAGLSFSRFMEIIPSVGNLIKHIDLTGVEVKPKQIEEIRRYCKSLESIGIENNSLISISMIEFVEEQKYGTKVLSYKRLIDDLEECGPFVLTLDLSNMNLTTNQIKKIKSMCPALINLKINESPPPLPNQLNHPELYD